MKNVLHFKGSNGKGTCLMRKPTADIHLANSEKIVPKSKLDAIYSFVFKPSGES